MSLKLVRDVAERAVSTYVQAFLGLELAAGANLLNVGGLKAAAVASLPAALSVIKSALAGAAKGDQSGSLLRGDHQGA